MIPKVIHYCWFGRNEKPELVQRCIASWRQYCPDYEIIEWNEDNFDVNMIPYTRDAYADQKWAFVSDYARLWIVYTQGGVYLDTDVLLKRNIDDLLRYDCWLASDDVRYINTGLGFGALKENYLIGAMMEAYNGYAYPSGTNVTRDTLILERELSSWKKSDRTQIVGGVIIVGHAEYGKYAKHLYMYSWAEEEERKRREEKIQLNQKLTGWKKLIWRTKCAVRSPRLIQYFDDHRGTVLERAYTFCAYDLLDNGIWYFIKRLGKKLVKRF